MNESIHLIQCRVHVHCPLSVCLSIHVRSGLFPFSLFPSVLLCPSVLLPFLLSIRAVFANPFSLPLFNTSTPHRTRTLSLSSFNPFSLFFFAFLCSIFFSFLFVSFFVRSHTLLRKSHIPQFRILNPQSSILHFLCPISWASLFFFLSFLPSTTSQQFSSSILAPFYSPFYNSKVTTHTQISYTYTYLPTHTDLDVDTDTYSPSYLQTFSTDPPLHRQGLRLHVLFCIQDIRVQPFSFLPFRVISSH